MEEWEEEEETEPEVSCFHPVSKRHGEWGVSRFHLLNFSSSCLSCGFACRLVMEGMAAGLFWEMSGGVNGLYPWPMRSCASTLTRT